MIDVSMSPDGRISFHFFLSGELDKTFIPTKNIRIIPGEPTLKLANVVTSNPKTSLLAQLLAAGYKIIDAFQFVNTIEKYAILYIELDKVESGSNSDDTIEYLLKFFQNNFHAWSLAVVDHGLGSTTLIFYNPTPLEVKDNFPELGWWPPFLSLVHTTIPESKLVQILVS